MSGGAADAFPSEMSADRQMDSHTSEISLLGLPLVLLAAAVISVPIARFGRLSAIVAYLVVGVVIGPYGLRLFSTPESVLPGATFSWVMELKEGPALYVI